MRRPLSRATFKKAVKKTLSKFGIYPNVFFYPNALKVFEFKELLKDAGIKKTDVILDIGCGAGLQTVIIGKKCQKIIGVDISQEVINEAKQSSSYTPNVNAEFFCSDVESMKFPDSYFDKVFSICVLEHIPNYAAVLKECYRVLKRGGQLVFSADSLETIEDPDLISKHRQDNGVYQYFRSDTLYNMLHKLGFRQINIHAIYRSHFAKNLFVKGIKNEFRFGYVRSLLTYPMLVRAEKSSEEKKGIFLVAKCDK
jgi:SAM-dependent methyltransferase